MSTIKVNTLEEATAGGATFFTAKAWVNFNGSGTVSIRNDGNVSSITDHATGSYSVNMFNNLSAATYSSTAGWSEDDVTSGGGSAYPGSRFTNNLTTSSMRFMPIYNATWKLDAQIACLTIVL